MAYDEEDFEDDLQSFLYEEEKKDAVKEATKRKGKKLTRSERREVVEDFDEEWDTAHDIHCYEYNEF